MLGLSWTRSVPKLLRWVVVQMRPLPGLAWELEEILNRLTEENKNKV